MGVTSKPSLHKYHIESSSLRPDLEQLYTVHLISATSSVSLSSTMSNKCHISSTTNQSKDSPYILAPTEVNNKARNGNRKVKNKNKIPSSCHCIPLYVLDELAARFLINMPLVMKEDPIRVCFQLELAYWFYIDFYLPLDPSLVEGSVKEFAAHMFRHVPFLQKYSEEVDEVVERWREYKLTVPVNGAVNLNSGWAFPKGKVNESEEPHVCATREVLEETGFDIANLIQQELYMEQVINTQTVRLYLVPGVAENTLFHPRVRGEISNIKWWDLASLPTRVGDKATKDRLGLRPHMFYNAIPFIKSLQKWAAREKNNYNFNANELHSRMDREATANSEVRSSNVEGKNDDEFNDQKLDMNRKTNILSSVRDGFCPPAWENFKLRLDLDQLDHQNRFVFRHQTFHQTQHFDFDSIRKYLIVM